FKDINIDTVPVPGQSDQVDLDVTLVEQSTGDIRAGVGYSSAEKLVLNASISQNNAFGSGNFLQLSVNSSAINKVYSLSYTNPYFTPNGVSMGYDIYRRNYDATSTTIGDYKSATNGAGVRFGIPVSETDTVTTGLKLEQTELSLTDTSPQRFKDYINTFGTKTLAYLLNVGWSRDTRDSILYPTKGWLQSVYTEIGLPGGDMTYHKSGYQFQYFQPLIGNLVFGTNWDIGFGKGYGGKPLPFFKNYYAGGTGSIRGYDTNSLGPREFVAATDTTPAGYTGSILGGTQRIVINNELLFPFPGTKNDKSVRGAIFFDVGRVRTDGSQGQNETFRYSAGVAVAWTSPIGPLKFSLGYPIAKKENDKLQKFQFQVGTVF
ncbi:MAG: hypothetical protein RLZZ502_1514, partial [Pseudomonadota bacterium]